MPIKDESESPEIPAFPLLGGAGGGWSELKFKEKTPERKPSYQDYKADIDSILSQNFFAFQGYKESETAIARKKETLAFLLEANETAVLDKISEKISEYDNDVFDVIVSLSFKTGNAYLLNKLMDPVLKVDPVLKRDPVLMDPLRKQMLVKRWLSRFDQPDKNENFERNNFILANTDLISKLEENTLVAILKFLFAEGRLASLSNFMLAYPEMIIHPAVESYLSSLKASEKASLIALFPLVKDKLLAEFFIKHYPAEIAAHSAKIKAEPELEDRPAQGYIPVSDRLFAHVQNDVESSGTSLAGSNFAINLPYYLKALRRMCDEKHISQETYNEYKDYFSPVKRWEDEITKILRREDGKNGNAGAKIENLTMEIIEALYQKGKIVLPGGYCGNPGHAMLYELSLDEYGITFNIVNTGAGIRNHCRYEAHDVDRYCPVMGYRFRLPEKEYAKRHNIIAQLIHQSIAPQIIPGLMQESFDVQKIYQTFESIKQCYGGEQRILPERLGNTYIKPQRGDICSWKVMMAAKRLPRELKLHLKYDNLMDYLGTILKLTPHRYQDLKNDPAHFRMAENERETLILGQIRQAQFAVENVARLSKKCVSAQEIVPEAAQAITASLDNIGQLLANEKKRLQVPLKVKYQKRLTREPAFQFEKSEEGATVNKGIKRSNPWRLPQLRAESGFDLLENLQGVLMAYKDDPSVDAIQLSSQVESCIQENFESLKKDFSTPIHDSVKSIQRLKLLFNILHQYNRALARQDNKHFSRRLLTRGMLSDLAFLVAKHCFSGKEALSSLKKIEHDTKDQFKQIVEKNGFKSLSETESQYFSELSQIKLSLFQPEETLLHALFMDNDIVTNAMVEHAGVTELPPGAPNLASQERISKALATYLWAKQRGEQFSGIEGLSEFENEFEAALLLKEILIEQGGKNLGREEFEPAVNMADFYQHFQFDRFCWDKGEKTQEQEFKIKLERKLGVYNPYDFYAESAVQSPEIESLFGKERPPYQIPTENESAVTNKAKKNGTLMRALEQLDYQLAGSLHVPATLEFMKTHFSALEDQDVQHVIFRNLFHPPQFYNAIQSNPALLEALCEQVNRCVSEELKKRPFSAQGKFYLSLRNCLIKYCDSSQQKHVYAQGECLKKSDKQIFRILKKEKLDDVTTEALTTSLILSKGLSLISDFSLGNIENLSEYWEALFLRSQRGLDLRQSISFESDMINHTLFQVGAKLMQPSDHAAVIPLVKQLLINHKIIREGDELSVEWPYCQSGDLAINIQTMAITRNGMRQAFLPAQIVGNPDFESYFGKARQLEGSISEGGQYCEFWDPETQRHYQFEMQERLRKTILKTELVVSGVRQWYTLSDLNSRNPLLSPSSFSMPGFLVDRQFKHWVSNNPKNSLVVMQDNQPVFLVEDKKLFLMQAGEKTNYKYVDINSAILPDELVYQLSQFDDLKFIEIFHNDAEFPVDILLRLSRYNLSFHLKNEQWACVEHPHFKLDLNPREIAFNRIGTGLRLHSVDEREKKEIIIVPDQQFVKPLGRESELYPNEYNPIIYDRRLGVYDAQMNAVSKLIGAPGLESALGHPAAHALRGKEKYIIFSVQEGEPVSHTVSDQAKLAYLYMGMRDHEKAFEALLSVSKSFEKPPLELIERLRQIIQAVPSRLAESGEDKETSTGAQATAVRLLALGMLMSIKERYPEQFDQALIDLPKNDLNTALMIYRQNVTRDYCSAGNLAQEWRRLYSRYLSLRRNVPINMRPSLKMERFMLEQAKEKLSFDDFPNIIYRDKQLALTEKLKFKRDLEGSRGNNFALLYRLEEEILDLKRVMLTKQKVDMNERGLPERVTLYKNWPVTPIHQYEPKKSLSLSRERDFSIDLPEKFLSGLAELKVKPPKLDRITGEESEAHLLAQAMVLEQDLIEGVKAVAQEQAQAEYFEGYFTENPQELAHLYKVLEAQNEGLSAVKITLENSILALLNQAPTYAVGQARWDLSLLGRTRQHFDLKTAVDLFLQNDLSYYRQKTNLTPEECQLLHQSIYQYLLLSTHQQRIDRALHAGKKKNYAELGKILVQGRQFDPAENPDLLVFECSDNKQLTQKQAEYLSSLSGPNAAPYQVLQLIMGGGKSKVLTPILAQRFADGLHLAMQIVPQALLNTNFQDMCDVFYTLFGKTVKKFEFSREQGDSIAAILKIEKQFLQAIVDREPIITTPESLQSLELKYLELMKISVEDDPDVPLKTQGLSRILTLLKTRTIPLVDEVDKALATKRVLNYTIGVGEAIPVHIREANIVLYGFLEKIHPGLISGEAGAPSAQAWKMMLQALGEALVDLQESPLQDIVLALTEEEKTALKRYLLEKSENIPAFVQGLDPIAKDRLALYKAQICQFLPETLLKKCNMHYGVEEGGDDLGVAIPYDNGLPSVGSRFSNYITAMNYTMQLQANRSISDGLLHIVLRNFSERIAVEDKINEDSAREAFSHYFGCDWNEIQVLYNIPSQESTLKAFFDQVRENKDLKAYCLSEYLLPSIKHNQMTLSSNAQSFVSMFSHRFIGFSGTDWNYLCYHLKILCQKEVSKGTDGQTIYHLLRKEAKILAPALETSILEHTVQNLLWADERTRAFIDLGGVGADVSNVQFSSMQALAFNDEAMQSKIKYILFFDNNELCALPVGDEVCNIIRIGSSDKEHIQRVLSKHAKEKITPDQCFTYYDTPHTVGTDISQDDNAHAILSIDKHTSLRDLLQAVMRMRKLSENQSIDYYIPQSVRDFYPEIKVWTVKEIIRLVVSNQIKRLSNDILASAFQKMDDALRSKVIEISLSLPYDQKKIWLEKFEDILYQKDNASCFEQYGGIDSNCKVMDLLERKQSKIGSIIRERCAQSHPDLEEEIEAILKSVIDHTLPFVPAEVKSSAEKSFQQSGSAQMQRQQQQQKQSQRENELENQRENEQDRQAIGKLRALKEKEWKEVNILFYFKNDGILMGIALQGSGGTVCSLNEYLASKNPPFIVDPDLYVSENFAKIHEGQRDLIDSYARNPMFVLHVYNPDLNIVRMMLITNKETNYFKEKMPEGVWIETPTGVLTAGSPHPQYDTRKYWNQKQQINYLAGNLMQVYEAHKTGQATWMGDLTKEKLDFYSDTLCELHSDKINLARSLEKEFLKEPGAQQEKGRQKGRRNLQFSTKQGLALSIGDEQLVEPTVAPPRKAPKEGPS